jgi:hypothetical protein
VLFGDLSVACALVCWGKAVNETFGSAGVGVAQAWY